MNKIFKCLHCVTFLIPFSVNGQTISVDVGHYLQSQGTVSAFGEYEFHYNKAMAEYVAQALAKQGYSVNITGYNGDAKDLVNRARLADNSKLFVSIHHDALQAQDLSKWTFNGKQYPYNDEIKGFGVFVSTKNPYVEKSLMCAKVIAENLIKSGFEPNYYHNKDIKGENKKLFFNNLPVYQYDNLIVLKSTKVPAILIEAGVLTNREEAKWIKTDEVRKIFAQVVAQSVKTCLGR